MTSSIFILNNKQLASILKFILYNTFRLSTSADNEINLDQDLQYIVILKCHMLLMDTLYHIFRLPTLVNNKK